MKIFNGVKQFNKAFTLIELIIVIAIIAILSVIAFPYYQPARKQLALQRSANKLAQDIRRAQGMALGAEAEGVGGEVPEGGYGVYFKIDWDNKAYRLYADTDPNGFWTPADDVFSEIIDLEEGIYIYEIPGSALGNPRVNINFKPPDPEVVITWVGLGEARIILCIEGTDCGLSTNKKTVHINKAGLIYVE